MVRNKGVLIRISGSSSVIVYSLRVRCAPAYKVDSKAALTYSLSLIKWIGYKARDPIEFKGDKRSTDSDLFLDLRLILLYWIFLI
jgi:hypothetical protein